MSLDKKHILAIDDTASIRTFLRISLQAHGATFHEAATAAEGVALSKRHKPDLIVLDLGLPDQDGMDILPALKEPHEGHIPKVVILSVRKEQQTKNTAFRLGADAYLSKPFLMENLIDIIEHELHVA